jgi:hypothetical protein
MSFYFYFFYKRLNYLNLIEKVYLVHTLVFDKRGFLAHEFGNEK